MPEQDPSASAPSHTPAATPAALRPIVALDAAECGEVLRTHRLCTLALADGDEPYAVPVYYGFDGETMYLGVAEGRKTAVLDRNPRVCITVAEPGAHDSWRSVMIAGRAVTITDANERASAIEVMMRHNRRPDRVAPPVAPPVAAAGAGARHGRGRMLRVADAVITGRARRPG